MRCSGFEIPRAPQFDSECPAIEFRGPRGSCSQALLPPCRRGRQVALYNRERRAALPARRCPGAGRIPRIATRSGDGWFCPTVRWREKSLRAGGVM